jgi:hypothetical protein
MTCNCPKCKEADIYRPTLSILSSDFSPTYHPVSDELHLIYNGNAVVIHVVGENVLAKVRAPDSETFNVGLLQSMVGLLSWQEILTQVCASISQTQMINAHHELLDRRSQVYGGIN